MRVCNSSCDESKYETAVNQHVDAVTHLKRGFTQSNCQTELMIKIIVGRNIG